MLLIGVLGATLTLTRGIAVWVCGSGIFLLWCPSLHRTAVARRGAAHRGVPYRASPVARAMNFEVDTHSAVPHYEQFRSQVAAAVLTGVLARGTRLPTIRQLPATCAWPSTRWPAPITSWRTKDWSTRDKKGTFIAEPSQDEHDGHAGRGRDERRQLLRQAAVTYASTAHALGLGPDHAMAMIREIMATADTPVHRVRDGQVNRPMASRGHSWNDQSD